MPLPLSDLISLDGASKVVKVKAIHTKARDLIERKNKTTAKKVNKNRKHIVFEPENWVWVHLRKERFPAQRKTKLDARGDGPFQVLEKINDNAYKIDLPGEYNVSATFNVSDLSPFDMDTDLRMNLFEEGGNDTCSERQQGYSKTKGQNGNFTLPEGPITRARAKKLKESFGNLAAFMHIELHQVLTKEEWARPIGQSQDSKKPNNAFRIQWEA
ncbi:uncharacterized protein LOC130966281 [Arachis stenosperma]|uniref:uncharacterized protein LOC130966281 n=1 Tax=Arachis stenosperma TaxID=217475 RepID=UPI0025AC4996|nr:uncharacterized protein LOC130966281 [Arachis stenosperma]